MAGSQFDGTEFASRASAGTQDPVVDSGRAGRIAARRAVRDAKAVTEAVIATQQAIDNDISAERMHRPGHRMLDGVDRSAGEAARAEGIAQMTDAWRTPAAAAVVTPPAGQSGAAISAIRQPRSGNI
jgi:hypothetical protein